MNQSLWKALPGVILGVLVGSLFVMSADASDDQNTGTHPQVLDRPMTTKDHIGIEVPDNHGRARVMDENSARLLWDDAEDGRFYIATADNRREICLLSVPPIHVPGNTVTGGTVATSCAPIPVFDQRGISISVTFGLSEIDRYVIRAALIPDGYDNAARQEYEAPHRNLVVFVSDDGVADRMVYEALVPNGDRGELKGIELGIPPREMRPPGPRDSRR